MVTLGYFLIAVHGLFLLLAAIIFGASFGGFLGSGYMIVAAVLVLLLWGVFAGLEINAMRLAAALVRGRGNSDSALSWASRQFLIATVLSAVTGLGLAFLSFVGCGPLWLPNLYHWGGMVGTILGFASYFILPVVARACIGSGSDHAKGHHWAWVVFAPLGVALLWGLAWLIPYLILKGDINESQYADSNRVYKLPFPKGESSWVIQGNNSSLNHNDDEKYAWDFRRRCGTPVLAARGGTIQSLPVDNNDGVGGKNNVIQVDHGDGTVAYYIHVQKGSARFRTIGATVRQGDELAKAGSVGNSMTGHIHFMVKRGGTPLAVSFVDVKQDQGIPRTFNSYKSDNR
jgi:hypothetical protein